MLPRARSVALVVAALLLAAACAGGGIDEVVDDLEQTLEEVEQPAEEVEDPVAGEPPAGEAPATAEQPSGQPSDPADEREAPEQAQTDGPTSVQVPDDRAGVGAACRAHLRDDIPRMVVEVLRQEGAGPAPASVDHLLRVLRGVVDKPAGVHLAGPRTVPGQARTWTSDDLRALAAQHRQARTSEQQTAMVLLAVRGDFAQQGVLGVALNASVMAIFPDNIGDLGTSLLGGRDAIERAVVVHEAGHLLCLVNLTYTSEIDHEDPDHPGHSRHRDSVMHWAVPNDAVSQVFSGPPPDEFHPDDLADLEGLRQGRY